MAGEAAMAHPPAGEGLRTLQEDTVWARAGEWGQVGRPGWTSRQENNGHVKGKGVRGERMEPRAAGPRLRAPHLRGLPSLICPPRPDRS